jgi:hypothetical protein
LNGEQINDSRTSFCPRIVALLAIQTPDEAVSRIIIY